MTWLFAKDKSSLQASDKKGKDVALRKSDRRQLLQRVLHVLKHSDDDPNNDDELQQQQQQLETLLSHVFLQGTLTQRTLIAQASGENQKKSDKKVIVYYRSPDKPALSDSSTTKPDALPLLWPYLELTQPIWIELDNKQLQLPTLALLSALVGLSHHGIDKRQLLLPTLTVFPPVSKYLCRGADLMKAGIADATNDVWQLATTQSNTTMDRMNTRPLVAICVQGNPQPFALGWLAPQFGPPVGPGTQGLAVHVYHCYGDDLWKQQLPTRQQQQQESSSLETTESSPFDLGHYGNPGFLEGQRVVPVDVSLAKTEEDDDEGEAGAEETPELNDEDTKLEAAEEEEEEEEGNEKPAAVAASAENDTSDHPPQAEADQDETKAAPSPDEILHQAVCRALVHLNAKKDLPMLMSQFYSQHVLKCGNGQIQIKQTRYKKFGVYVKEQVQREFLQVGPDASKKDPMAMLVGFNPKHDDLTTFVQERKQEKALEAAAGGGTANATAGRTRLVLADLFCVPNHFVKLLRLDNAAVKAANASSAERKNTGLLTAKEVRAILDDYVEREQLVDPLNQAQVVLDGPLTDALYKQKKNANNNNTPAAAAVPTHLSRKQLVAAWQGKMETAYAVVSMPGNKVLKLGRGKPPTVTIEVTRRQSKKFVTKVHGMEQYDVYAQELRQQLATRLACAVTAEENVPGVPKGGSELQLQGNWVDEIEAILLGDPSLTSHGGARDSPYQLPPNAIQVLLRKGVPARKNRPQPKKK